jgi:Uma2 family endonuclease
MSLAPLSSTDPVINPDILASAHALPTEDDLPSDDGAPMDTPRHLEQMILLLQSLRTYWSARTRYFVGGNMFLYYDSQNLAKFCGPDFFLVLDVEDRARKSWLVWREGMHFPDVIIELLSDSTRTNDKREKKALYERVFHTPEYYLYDPVSQEFVSYHLQSARYQRVEPDEEGRVYSPSTNLYLAVRDEWLRWMTPAGVLLPTPLELAEQAQHQAEQAQQRAEQAQHQAEQAQHQAEQAQHRAEQAEQLLALYQQRFGTLD